MADRPQRRRFSRWFIGVIVVIAAAWVGYWFAAREVAEVVIDRLAAGRVAGGRIDCANPRLDGFPLRVDLRCRRVTYAGREDNLTADLTGLSATAPLYDPGTIDATLDPPLTVNLPALGVTSTVSWSAASADLSAWIGGLTGARATFSRLSVDNAGFTAPISDFEAATAEAAIRPIGEGSYRLAATVRDLALTARGGRVLPAIDGELRLIARRVGDTLGTRPLATFADWARTGGTAEIERIRLAAGDAVLLADGTLTLSDDGLLSGSLLLRFNSLEALADLIEAIRPGSREQIALPLEGLAAFSVPVETDEGTFRQTGLTFTDGIVWLGIVPLPIAPIPPIRF